MPDFARWSALAESLGLAGDGRAVFDGLMQRYAEPGRFYHNGDHLDEVLAEFDGLRAMAESRGDIELAIWFHDAIYDPRAGDNEARSAALAAEALASLGATRERIGRVERLILATRHRDPPSGIDEAILIDADLGILGAAPERFDAYERDIRREYAHVADADFRAGRSAVLRMFLARPRIYSTEAMFSKREAPARANLRRSLGALQAG
jgi:predicted metal-dependent HD superfamily phosphohydrolase